MPTQTFFNLPEQKKQRLIAGAMKEFTERSLNEASISNIVKNAEISRGSFYQYFEDKKDLYFFLIGKFKYNYHRLMVNSFKEAEGDFYRGYQIFAEKYIQNIMNSEKFGFFENMYLHMNYQINQESGVNTFMPSSSMKKKAILNKEDILNVVKREQVKACSDQEFFNILRYILNILDDTIMEGFWKELSIEETQKLFSTRLEWMTKGVLK
ncbi:regulatory protein, tetR family [Marinilactibacillus piezotolerans]|uniref:Regulatory protein, tetR family n=1 Tax=Marinilactibacillus piezotolerans TaxID=258723 RepID=A0A1I3W5W2_9LACT|nr:TetR/AcrR family transcriptional regulator [Marinilactibacillus piezotolerans]SFK01801.1 regulatory protein, tetR family [Marinilactibacillus piezotolerans]